MGSSPGFGSNACHYFVALIRLGFPAATAVTALTLRHTLTRRFILQEARRQAFPPLRAGIALRLLVSARFQVLLLPLSGCFSPFPHGTSSLSVAKRI